MTDYGIELPDDLTTSLDHAYTEETLRRIHELAVRLYDELERSPRLEPVIRELNNAVWRLGVHLDMTAGLNITGGDT